MAYGIWNMPYGVFSQKHCALNKPLFTTSFSYRKRSEQKDKQSSDILLQGTQKIFRRQKVELCWITPTSQMGPFL